MLGFRSGQGLFAVAVAVQLAVVSAAFFEPFNVSYDHRALLISGKRRMLISAGIHYPRATPEMWPGLIAKSKEGGADVIQTYVFWNGHEPTRGQYDFKGRYDIVKFAKLIGSQGLYLHLRIGPYACAEWNFGGFPVWLRDIPGIEFRTNNEPFKIENEYGNIEGQYGQGGKEYVRWAAKMALGLGAGVPWVMCKQTDAPETIIDSCNAFYCDGFRPNSYKKPAFWTEDWNGWYASWGGRLPHRPVRDNAFAVARFFQRGGSFQNYYMFFGGTNFGRTAGGPFQITSYDYDAPIDEYGLLTQPKWGHLKDLHAAIKLCEPALVVVNDSPQYVKLGPMQEAHIYSSERVDTNRSLSESTSICSAFLANIDEHKSVTVKIFGEVYSLPPWSVSILPNCKNVAFNTAKVGSQVSIKTVESGSPSRSNKTEPGELLLHNEGFFISSTWMTLKESIGASGNNSFTAHGILEHLNVTKDTSDYLWYITRINVSDEDIAFWEEMDFLPSLTINKTRDVVRVFVNGHLSGSKFGNWVPLKQPLHLVQGCNELVLLSETVGLQNYGAFLEKDGAGFRGQIKLSGFKNGDIDLSNSLWTYRVGLKGEFAELYAPDKQKNADWTDLKLASLPSAFTWYKNTFDAPEGDDPVALDLGSMGKGQAWVNGHSIGRYWSLIAPETGCSKSCNYRGAYNEKKCTTNCGLPTQSWYHIPRAWLQPSNNLLVIFEETGGNPLNISLSVHSTKTICGKVSETHYPPLSTWYHPDFINGKISINEVAPQMHLQCDDGHMISAVKFASYGTPHGSCQNYSLGKCHASTSLSLVMKACQGKNNCTINVSNTIFGDPCRRTVKTLAVEAECASVTDNKMLLGSW
ncbi:beta-galactosidase 15 isoform X2 [Phoenix dactylifera]|uniref:beta-galactosidase n=1 Tax=Phoenix dactylifera TaxID=42345 RepID=A0A8B9ATG7_PHODC|nr:beta-galactosidase 15 isoform X2 [Phoenix dactylifera]